MVYSPRLSQKASASVKSLSFALGLPMTKAIERAVALMPLFYHPGIVCQKCQDKSRCGLCGFNPANMPDDIKKLWPAQD